MDYAQTRAPEQPTQPPELPIDTELAYQSVYDETLTHETERGQYWVRQILSTGSGMLASAKDDGSRIYYDAGDLWTALVENEEPHDASVLAGAVVGRGSPVALARAVKFLDPLINAFVDTHAKNMAKRVAQQRLLEWSARR